MKKENEIKEQLLLIFSENELNNWLKKNPPPKEWKEDKYSYAYTEMPLYKPLKCDIKLKQLGSPELKISKSEFQNKVRTGRAIACYMFPLVGIVTYLNLRDEYPEKAKKYGFISILGTATYASRLIYKKIKKGEI